MYISHLALGLKKERVSLTINIVSKPVSINCDSSTNNIKICICLSWALRDFVFCTEKYYEMSNLYYTNYPSAQSVDSMILNFD